MITLIQRVKKAKVKINGNSGDEIDAGFLLYVGFEEGDDLNKVQWSVNKIVNLRTFQDNNGKMNLSLNDINGSLMIISNFTLPADIAESGRRPSFTKSAKPEIAEELYNQFIEECRKLNVKVITGKFGAMMEIDSVADGPVNYILKR